MGNSDTWDCESVSCTSKDDSNLITFLPWWQWYSDITDELQGHGGDWVEHDQPPVILRRHVLTGKILI